MLRFFNSTRLCSQRFRHQLGSPWCICQAGATPQQLATKRRQHGPIRLLCSQPTEVTIANIAGTGNELVYANADGTLKRAVGLGINNGSLSVQNNLTPLVATPPSAVPAGQWLVHSTRQRHLQQLFHQPNQRNHSQLLSTDSQGQLRMVVLPTNSTTFCNRTGVDSSCYGAGAEAMGNHDTAIGTNSKADAAEGSTALGADSNAAGNGSAAIGVNATSSGTGSIALGYNTMANGLQSFAIGADAVANGVGAIAIGPGARASGFNTNATAIGAGAIADGTSATSIGASAFSSGINVTAIGAGARNTHRFNSLRAGAATTRDRQTVIGSASTEVTVPNLAGAGTGLIAANQDGTLAALQRLPHTSR